MTTNEMIAQAFVLAKKTFGGVSGLLEMSLSSYGAEEITIPEDADDTRFIFAHPMGTVVLRKVLQDFGRVMLVERPWKNDVTLELPVLELTDALRLARGEFFGEFSFRQVFLFSSPSNETCYFFTRQLGAIAVWTETQRVERVCANLRTGNVEARA